MLKSLWVVIDPKFDRPFFSSDPPPDTLERKPELRVFRFEWEVPEPHNADVFRVLGEDQARQIAQDVFDTAQAALRDEAKKS